MLEEAFINRIARAARQRIPLVHERCALTRFRWFSVTGRNASHVYKLKPVEGRTAATELGVRYLAEGSVRKSAERVRISAQLVDASSGSCLWAERHDFADADMFEVQDAIAQRVAGAIET